MYLDKLPMVGTKQETIQHYKLQIKILQRIIDSEKQTEERWSPLASAIRDAFVWAAKQIAAMPQG